MEQNRLRVEIGKLRLRTPLITASGTSGSSNEIKALTKKEKIVKALGAFVTKGVSLKSRAGNKGTRVIEIRTGLLNSIGLQNKGAKRFLVEELPKLLSYELPIIVNISASSIEQFGELAEFLVKNDINRKISGLEINVSCPNIKKGGLAFGVNPHNVEKIVKAVKKRIPNDIIIITKLSPNVTDITQPAKAAISGGTNALSMINTLRGIAINIKTKKPYLGNKIGGVSGPAIKPIGVFMVYECFRKISECRHKKIPIIGIGGISIWEDVIEYIMAGATAVGIGTAWLVKPEIFPQIKKDLVKYLDSNNSTIKDLIGKAHE